MAAEYVVRRIHQIESLQEGRVGKLDTVIVYALSSGTGPDRVTQEFTLRLAKDGVSPADIKTAVENDARLKAAVLGAHGTV